MTVTEELLAEIRLNRVDRNSYRNQILESNKKIESLLSQLLRVNKSVSENYVINGYTIAKDEYYEAPTIDSTNFERARIFVSVGFNENTTAGISIDLYYAGHRICEIMSVSPTQAGMSAGSESFDINRLSGFNFVIINHDTGQEVKINSLRIVLYNE